MYKYTKTQISRILKAIEKADQNGRLFATPLDSEHYVISSEKGTHAYVIPLELLPEANALVLKKYHSAIIPALLPVKIKSPYIPEKIELATNKKENDMFAYTICNGSKAIKVYFEKKIIDSYGKNTKICIYSQYANRFENGLPCIADIYNSDGDYLGKACGLRGPEFNR